MNRPKVLVTGAASGIGRATALRFAHEGYDVCANDIQPAKLTALLSEFPPGHHLILKGSYADKEIIQEGEKLIRESWGSLNALVSCAGISEQTDPIAMDIERWRVIFDTMVNGCILISKLAAQFMPNGGRIIHVTSIHGTRAEFGASSYSMAKSAINQFCRSLAVQLADRNILVNAVAPGFVDTAMSRVNGMNELESEWFKTNYVQGHHLPLRRAATADEIAGVAFFLAGKDASYITGQVITVDGGLTITF
ncbi:SDR family NAD(P)-dependent oxidoreductase [Segetibacter koreensis]|uniref:SDR family NAD(P)-dependent oxidoreductase n=1 Tax=Segetibacter koreensis TaxID=398037 RepID=UPI00036DB85D|nr:SDR family oxidoreductase [Segetibacter koreensis]